MDPQVSEVLSGLLLRRVAIAVASSEAEAGADERGRYPGAARTDVTAGGKVM